MISSSNGLALSRLAGAVARKGPHGKQPIGPIGPPRLRSSQQIRQGFFLARSKRSKGFGWQKKHKNNHVPTAPAVIVIGTLLIWSLYPADDFQRLRSKDVATPTQPESGDQDSAAPPAKNAWFDFASGFERFSRATDLEWTKVSDKLVDLLLPEWSKLIPGYVRKLQRELSMAPGSLADEIWREAHDPAINPEIEHSARVRVSEDLCDEEKTFLSRRRQVVRVALARYLGLEESDVHPDDVPVIALCGSGGGLRALVAGTGSLLAASEDGLFDCVTYTSGVSGSCWLQALYHSSIASGDFNRVIDHLKARLGVHIAYPPVAFSSVIAAPTNKYLLSGMVEKLKGDSGADFGLVDVYGLLLAARLLVPKGELGVDARDFKLSNQREHVQYGQNPLPIYTAVRHEIPGLDPSSPKETPSASEAAKDEAKQESWFQWFEMTPYEFFCEELAAGIPTWAMGRKFKGGSDLSAEEGFYMPEIRMPLLMGIFGSAFCATLSHYYREIRPLVQGLGGFQAVDELISGRNEDLSKVHPIDPATIPNFAFGMNGRLPTTASRSVCESEHIQLMDAGMSNNLPIYPLLRRGRDVEVLVAFDASADVKTDNWLSVVDGYARRRSIKGWPVGIGWPKDKDSAAKTAAELGAAQAESQADAEAKLAEAKVDQAARRIDAGATSQEALASDNDAQNKKQPTFREGDETAGELGYCTVWVGSTSDSSPSTSSSSSSPSSPTPSKAIADAASSPSALQSPDAGITVVYLPFLANPAAPGVDPATSDFMSTWNFVYTPEQVDSVVTLARANYAEARAQIRATVRAVYERKRHLREAREEQDRRERYRRLVRLGVAGKLGEGDHFS